MKLLSIGLFAALAVSATALCPTAASAQTEEVIHSFGGGADGAAPEASLLYANGMLYGTTLSGGGTGCSYDYGCGTMFSIDPATGAENVLYSFCGQQNCVDGSSPVAGLIDVKNKLYGTTAGGGTYGFGTAFSLDLKTGAEKVVYSFCSHRNCTDGSVAGVSLNSVRGTLFGTTEQGGRNQCAFTGCGTVFWLDIPTGFERVLYSFCRHANCTDGEYPSSSLIDGKGTLYGTTSQGGNGYGVVFALDPKTGSEAVLHSFGGGNDGLTPEANLIDVSGTLYGTTSAGGGNTSGGTVFALNPTTGAETVLHSFTGGTDGEYPLAGLIDVTGTLYGTTFQGGANSTCSSGCGTVYSLDPSSGTESVIYSFCSQANCTDGKYPDASLLNVGGTLYGTTAEGGSYGEGTVFALKVQASPDVYQ